MLANNKKMDDLLDEKIQASVKPDIPDAYRKLEAVMELEINVNGLSKRLSEHLESNDPQYKELVLKDEADFRRWLTEHYADLDALNRQWGTAFAKWEEVVPLTHEEAKARGDDNYAAWADHREFMDDVFARAFCSARKRRARSRIIDSAAASEWPSPFTHR